MTVYTFPKTTIDLSEHHSSRSQHTDFINYVVQPGDTLHSISVKYSCPIASIKRLNHIWSDQEFHARSRLKLPAGRFRLIADAIEEDESSKLLQPETSTTTNATINPAQTSQLIREDPNLSTALSQQPGLFLGNNNNYTNTTINDVSGDTEPLISNPFKQLDQSIARARYAAQSYNAHGDALMKTLADSGNIVDEDQDDLRWVGRREAETLLVDLSDSGLSYSGLLLCMFIICLICPLAFVIYLEEVTHHEPFQ